MKKYFVFLLVFAFLFTFIAAPKNVNAFVPTPEPEVWEWYGEGVSGEEIPMGTITTTPREWYQLKANGLKVDGATRICHGFDAGRYGWTGEIFRMVGGTWVKLPTTVGWVPDAEGSYMACATAPAAGTYALFGYFDKAKAPVKEGLPDCSSLGINPPVMSLPVTINPVPFRVDFHNFTGTWSAFPNTSIQMIIKNSNPPLVWNPSATVMSDPTGHFDFGCFGWYYEGPEVEQISFTIRLITPVCYEDTPIYFMVTSP